jgi:hypothetical protein
MQCAYGGNDSNIVSLWEMRSSLYKWTRSQSKPNCKQNEYSFPCERGRSWSLHLQICNDHHLLLQHREYDEIEKTQHTGAFSSLCVCVCVFVVALDWHVNKIALFVEKVQVIQSGMFIIATKYCNSNVFIDGYTIWQPLAEGLSAKVSS